MGLRPGGRFRRVRGCGVDWYAGIRGGGAGLDWETCENGNSGNWWMRCSVMGMAGAWSRISILTRSRDLPRRRRCLRGSSRAWYGTCCATIWTFPIPSVGAPITTRLRCRSADETRGTCDIEQVFAYWGIVIHSARRYDVVRRTVRHADEFLATVRGSRCGSMDAGEPSTTLAGFVCAGVRMFRTVDACGIWRIWMTT